MDEYPRLPTDTDDGMLLVISGPSGVGKTTITRGVERSIRGSVFSVSVTTRPQTRADVEGVDYHFITEVRFAEMILSGDLLEWAKVYGNHYGTPRPWVVEQLKRGRLVILEIDAEGARQVKAAMPEAYSIFILPPSEDELLERLRGRKREDEAIIQRRFAQAQREIAYARSCGAYDTFIVNRVLDDAMAQALALVRARREQGRSGLSSGS